MVRLLPLLVALCWLAPAHADDEALTRGRQLRQEAATLMRAGKTDEAAARFRAAVDELRRAGPSGQPELMEALFNLGQIARNATSLREATRHFEEALALGRQLLATGELPQAERAIANTLSFLGDLHCQASQYRQAFRCYEELLTINRRLHQQPHPDLSHAIYLMGRVYREMGSPLRGLPFYEESFEMMRTLYPKEKFPNGHPNLAAAYDRMAEIVTLLGARDRAIAFREESFRMRMADLKDDSDPREWRVRSIYLHNLAMTYSSAGRHEQALLLFAESKKFHDQAMPPEQFPNGSFGQGLHLTNHATCLHRAGRHDEGLAMMREAHAMFKRLFPPTQYPAGHIDILITANDIANFLRDVGKRHEAREAYEQAIALNRRYLEYLMTTNAETDMMRIVASYVYSPRDGMLNATDPGESDDADYQHVWYSKGLVSRWLEHRRLATRALSEHPENAAIAARWKELAATRRQLDRTLQQPLGQPDRDARLRDLTARKERLETELNQALPEWSSLNTGGRLQPADLAALLPADAVFLDFMRWKRIDHQLAKFSWLPQPRIDIYTVFLLAPRSKPIRIDLGPAAPIDRAIDQWRKEILANTPTDDAERRTAHTVEQLVWSPVARHLPPNTKTLHLSPDAALAKLPFAAIPLSSPQRRLLESYTVSVVPHGSFLARQFRRTKREAESAPTILAVGEVDYGGANAPWPALPGTTMELHRLRDIAPMPLRSLTGRDASVENLLRELPTATFAHIATHGNFRNDDLLVDERALRELYIRLSKYDIHPESMPQYSRVGARNPLGYSGLVLAGANNPNTTAVISGETIVTLPLDRLRLCVLSACETGLGELADSEGVHGLQRAFHLAGCPNVVASLWKVNDAATAALMAKFYHELWVNKKPPIEALREAQLAIYRHPELIPDLSGERGAPKLKERWRPN